MEFQTPPELRALCFQLSSISPTDLPRNTPALQRLVLACRVPLSSATDVVGKAEYLALSTTHVLVHKLKTQLTTLLYGRCAEGRFVAAVLIRVVIEVGGWEVLKGCEPWVRGLLSMLAKPDSAAAKEICIVVLTKIYCMTRPYQTVLREVTTPTLPSFIMSCIAVISNKSSKSPTVPSSLIETVLRSFALLVPHHSSIFRPFASQLRVLVKAFLAPTLSSTEFAPSSLKVAARGLTVILHQTAAKNAGGEEWGKAVRELVKDIHSTADEVFRAVIEDWESAAGYIPSTVDVSTELSGGGRSGDDLPRWVGIDAGLDRLTGLLELLSEYFKYETSTSVSLPISTIMDLTSRILSILAPSPSDSGQGQSRPNPAIDRDERDRLWAALPDIHVATLSVMCSTEERLQGHFLPFCHMALDQLSWVFTSSKHDPRFLVKAYDLSAKILRHVGKSLSKSQTLKVTPIIRSCIHSLQAHASTETNLSSLDSGAIMSTGHGMTPSHGAKTSINSIVSISSGVAQPELTAAARDLLPLFFSHLPQHHLDIALRSQLERSSILTHNYEAMMTSIVNPFVGKNGRVLASIVPYLSRQIPYDSRVEVLLRPRMPVLPSAAGVLPSDGFQDEDAEHEDMDVDVEVALGIDDFRVQERKQTLSSFVFSERREEPFVDSTTSAHHPSLPSPPAPYYAGIGSDLSALQDPEAVVDPSSGFTWAHQAQASTIASETSPGEHTTADLTQFSPTAHAIAITAHTGVALDEAGDSSDDDESVHLTMALDTESEDED